MHVFFPHIQITKPPQIIRFTACWTLFFTSFKLVWDLLPCSEQPGCFSAFENKCHTREAASGENTQPAQIKRWNRRSGADVLESTYKRKQCEIIFKMSWSARVLVLQTVWCRVDRDSLFQWAVVKMTGLFGGDRSLWWFSTICLIFLFVFKQSHWSDYKTTVLFNNHLGKKRKKESRTLKNYKACTSFIKEQLNYIYAPTGVFFKSSSVSSQYCCFQTQWSQSWFWGVEKTELKWLFLESDGIY